MDTAAVSTVVEKAGTHLRDGNYYEASQLYRSAFTRFGGFCCCILAWP